MIKVAKYRTEKDFLGEREVRSDCYWGIHTQRALENFPFGKNDPGYEIVKSLALVKKACCIGNKKLGFIEQELADAIIAAADEIIAGALKDQFPVTGLQGGAGTSVNMNINEVIANRAMEILGHNKGEYWNCHPVEHVNLHQSTNDVYPTAVKVTLITAMRELSAAAASLQGALQQKEKEFASIVTIGRTELQDAVPMTLGAQFSAYSEAIARDRWRTFKCEERLRIVNIGGTAVGTGLTAPREYIFGVIEHLRELSGYGLTRGDNMVDQTANIDALVEVSGILCAHAANIAKIAGDLRLLNLLKEIRLPPVQTGSSVMPGKVNPVVAEAAISVSMKVRANHQIVAECAAHGSLQINEFLPLAAYSLVQSSLLLIDIDRLLKDSVTAIEACPSVCAKNLHSSTSVVTAFLPAIGYSEAERLSRMFSASGRDDCVGFLKEQLGEDAVNDTLSPEKVMALGFVRKKGATNADNA